MARNEGYYWCKYKGEWIIAFWHKLASGYWEAVNSFADDRNDADFDEIDENQITRKDKTALKKQIEEIIEDSKEQREYWNDLDSSMEYFDYVDSENTARKIVECLDM